MRVLHICTEKSWRGGENQIRLFIEGSFRFGVVNFVAIPRSGRGYPKFLKIVETLGLSSSSAYSPVSIYQLVQFCKKNQIEVLDGQGSGGLSLALWVKKFLPTAWREKSKESKVYSVQKKTTFHLLEPLARTAQLWYMRNRRTTEVVSNTLIRFHPVDAREWIYRELQIRLRSKDIPLDNIFYGR